MTIAGAFSLITTVLTLVTTPVVPTDMVLRSISLAPGTGPPGSTVTVTGYGFPYQGCAATATLYWEGHIAQQWVVPLASDDSEPSFVTNLIVPEDAAPPGVTLVSLCGSGELAEQGPTATFAVAPPAASATTSTTTSASAPKSAAVPSTLLPTTASRVPTTTTSAPSTTSSRTGGGPITGTRSPPPRPAPTAHPVAVPSSDGAIRPVRMTATLAAVDPTRPTLAALMAVGILATLLILLVAFPAELFNKTYEENEAEIRVAMARIGLRRDAFPRALGLVLFVLVGAVLSTLLAGGEGAAGNPVAQVLGFAVAIPVVTFAYGLPSEILAHRWTGVPARLRVLPAALFVAVVCATLSWLLRLDPPYLYGLFAGYAALRERHLSRRQEGKAILLGVLCLGGVGVLGWLAWNPVHGMAYGPHPSWPAVLADAALFWIFVLAAESLVFTLPPVRFLDGRKLRDWHFAVWLAPQLLAAGLFSYVFVLRVRLHAPDGGVAAMVKALLFFVMFGALSVAFWSYFRWEGRPTRPRRASVDKPSRF